MFYEVIPIKIFREDKGVLTYAAPEEDVDTRDTSGGDSRGTDGCGPRGNSLKVGQVVEIPLGRGKTYGVVTRKVKNVDFKTKPISRAVYKTPLPAHVVKAIFWLAEYYAVPLPMVAKMFLPTGVGKTRRKSSQRSSSALTAALQGSSEESSLRSLRPSKNPLKLADIPLNAAQKKALKSLENTKTPTRLLFGVTGSGKTNIYLKLALKALECQKSTVLLVPEIALTSQLVQVFEQTFGTRVKLVHSQQTKAERHLIWEEILEAEEPQIIIGARSALLTPVKNLGLIIVDEAHEEAYFQDSTPKYSALRLASFMAAAEKIPCIYGTATPLVTDYYLAKSKNALTVLSEKAKESAATPNIQVIDLKDKAKFSKNRYFSDALLDAIARNLKNKHQTLIFHNRRGSAPLTICENCGWQALCPNCFLPLTLHSDKFSLICHTCGYESKVPTACPECGNPSIIHKGFGTKLLEAELSKLFPAARIARFDADNRKGETLNSNYDKVKNGEIDIIIGTQTIAKGLDLPLLATVGVVQADAGLSLPDYAAEEKTFQLLSQVIGRVGRGHLSTAEAYVQTYQPESPVIKAGISASYPEFYDYAISRRRAGRFPPFYYLAKLTVTYKTEAAAIRNARLLKQELAGLQKELTGVQTEKTKVAGTTQIKAAGATQEKLYVSLPTPAFHEHTSSGYSWQIVLRAKSRKTLLSAIQKITKKPGLHFTLDPPSLI